MRRDEICDFHERQKVPQLDQRERRRRRRKFNFHSAKKFDERSKLFSAQQRVCENFELELGRLERLGRVVELQRDELSRSWI